MCRIFAWVTKLFGEEPPYLEDGFPKLNGELREIWKEDELPIYYVIYADKQFIVFLDKRLTLDWATADEHTTVDQKLHNQILNEGAVVETTPCEGLSFTMRFHFKRLVGEALARSFDNDYAGAKAMLKNAAKYVALRSEETSRRWYLWASFVGALPFVFIGLILWMGRELFLPWLTPAVFWLGMAASAGALGALLSVITRAGKQKLDCSAGRRLHLLEGLSRIVAGAISALMISTALRAGLVFSALASSHNATAMMITLAFVSGMTERLATHLVSDLGAKDNGGRRGKNSDAEE